MAMLSEQAGCPTGRGRSHFGGGLSERGLEGWRSTSRCPIGRQANLHSVCPSQPGGRTAQLPERIPQRVTAPHSHQRKADGFQRDPLCPPPVGWVSITLLLQGLPFLPSRTPNLAGWKSREPGEREVLATPVQIPPRFPSLVPNAEGDLLLLACLAFYSEYLYLPFQSRRPSKQIINNSER